MKIVILNGSPRSGGNTELMAKAFAEAASPKHQVEILNIARMNIHGCLGCGACYANGGKCVQQDDMPAVLKALSDADMVVFASPIYWFDITAQLKTVIDRMYVYGATGVNFNKTALLLDAGATPEGAEAGHVFDAAIAQYKAMTAYLKWEDKGIIAIPDMRKKGSMSESPMLEQVKALAAAL